MIRRQIKLTNYFRELGLHDEVTTALSKKRLAQIITGKQGLSKKTVNKVLMAYFADHTPEKGWRFYDASTVKKPKANRPEKSSPRMSFTKDPTKQKLKTPAGDFYRSDEWRALRYAAFAAYGRKCGCCGASPETGAVMHVDHIKPRFTHPELALELSNLQILCADCNQGKGAWDSTDWRWKQEEQRMNEAFKKTV